MNSYLFFDTETTGLPQNYKAPVTDFANWPRLVQLAFIVANEHAEIEAEGNWIIKPEGFIIPEKAASIHGITTERAMTEGCDLRAALVNFAKIMSRMALTSNNVLVVGHNIAFDEKIVGCEYLRCGLENWLPKAHRFCTMQASTDFCQLQGMYGYKWPKLQELHRKLFNDDFAEAHNAAADIQATVRCFFELKRLEIIDV